MSGANLWHDDGTPRRPHPACPFCGADKIRSKYDDARCMGCLWKGTLTELAEFDLIRRPGARLLEFLETRGIGLAQFATEIGSDLANIRRYTHPKIGTDSVRCATPKTIVRWAAHLDVDVGSFYRRPKE